MPPLQPPPLVRAKGAVRISRTAIAFVAVLAAALAVFGVLELAELRRELYVPPEFRGQLDLVRPGMTRGEVQRAVTIFDTQERTAPNVERFTLEPKGTGRFRGIRNHIVVKYDEAGRVVSCKFADG